MPYDYSTDTAPGRATARESWWAREAGGKKERGIRVQRGPHFIWLPLEEALALANDIADQIQDANK
ncbi:hypothetical protein HMPREF3159_07965 [Brachybacterium sp. HMSC06H03]|uniref:hypothetical protein n=1 Tax=Brachybacterium sp. HMSC06H03 TaxID=1581127 RepID=UPI0008A27C9B|nr:hypothetical protein [Brachybacterium sp. HMSC06H03]OFT58151.1 hypothetical protein HMPREF3159_07965 [Brachybacterium sp. HMSC06H03]